MHLLYCDETNLSPSEHDFFIYGGVVIPPGAAKPLHDAVEQIRRRHHVPENFLLKFNPRPDTLAHDDFIQVKQAILETAAEHSCQLIVSLILHNIAASPDIARRNEINRVLYHFECLLNRETSHGLVLIDRFSDTQIDAHLRERFAVGVRGLPYTDPMRLERIVGYHYSAIGQSHFGSVVDIVVGSFRFAVNSHSSNDTNRLASAVRLLDLVGPLFIRSAPDLKVDELSLFFSPKVITVDRYRGKYAALRDFLAEHGVDSRQEITDTRTR